MLHLKFEPLHLGPESKRLCDVHQTRAYITVVLGVSTCCNTGDQCSREYCDVARRCVIRRPGSPQLSPAKAPHLAPPHNITDLRAARSGEYTFPATKVTQRYAIQIIPFQFIYDKCGFLLSRHIPLGVTEYMYLR